MTIDWGADIAGWRFRSEPVTVSLPRRSPSVRIRRAHGHRRGKDLAEYDGLAQRLYAEIATQLPASAICVTLNRQYDTFVYVS